MYQRIYDFNVDFMVSYKIPTVTFIQNDTSVNIMNITLVSNGTPIDITGCTVELRFRKSDGYVVLGMAQIINAINGRITYRLGTNEIASIGNVLVGVMLYGQNGERASSYPFRFTVVNDIGGNYDATSSTEYPILTQLIADTTEIRNDYLDLMSQGGTDHIHTNKSVLDGLSDNAGVLNYNGQAIQGSGGTADSITWANVTGKPTFSTVATSGSYVDLINRPTVPTQLSQLSEDITHRLVTDTEKNTWNAKQNALSGDVAAHYHSADRNWNNITNKPTIPATTSQLTNDSSFVTSADVDSRISQITGGAGGDMYRSTYDTDLDGIVDRAEIADSVQWTNVQGRPTIPTTTSQLTNDSGFVTSVPTQLSQLSSDATHRLTTDTEKTSWNAKADNAVATTTVNGLMSSTDKIKLDGIADSANNYTHPSTHPSTMITGLATVATTGSYADLINRPTIPTDTNQLAKTDVYTRTQVDNLIAAIPTGTSITFVALTVGETVTIDGSVDSTAPTVTISPSAGTYSSAQTVTISTNETATIYYTLDGTTPTTSSSAYSSPINISSTTTIRYFAQDTAGNSSVVQSRIYTIDTVAPNNVTNLATSNVTGNSLTLSWTASTSTDVASYEVYQGATLLSTVATTTYNVSGLTVSTAYTFTIRARDTVGNLASGTSVNITTSAVADTTAPTVTVSPVAGTYTSSQTVTLTANETATIYYTTNGTTPTTASTVYTAPISISVTTTLQFFARDTAGNNSAVQTQVYTINVTPTQLITNGDFANGTTGWSLHANASVSGGVLTLNATAAYQNTTQTIAVQPNTTYTLSGTITGNGNIVIEEQTSSYGWIGNAYQTPGMVSNDVATSTFTTSATTAYVNVYLTSQAAGTSTFDNISLIQA